MVDYVRAGDPETNPPITLTTSLPWYAATTPTIAIQVQDTESGLDLASGRYRISTDNGSTWSNWSAATVSGPLGSRSVQTVTAASAGPFVGGTSNLIQFRTADVVSNVVTATYTVKIDTAAGHRDRGPHPWRVRLRRRVAGVLQ